MRKVELLPTRDCEAGYGPGRDTGKYSTTVPFSYYMTLIQTRTTDSFSSTSSMKPIDCWIANLLI